MPIVATCGHCQKSFKVSSKFAGKKAKCTGCGEAFSIPALPAPQAASGAARQDDLLAGLAAAATPEAAAPARSAPRSPAKPAARPAAKPAARDFG